MKKLLNNPWFVVVLGTLAAGVVVWNATAGMRRRNSKAANPAAAAAVARQAAISAENAAKAEKAEIAKQAALLASAGADATAFALAAKAADSPGLPAVQFGVVPSFAGIDLAKVRARLPEWLDTPARDPFSRPLELVQKATNTAVIALKLKGVWRQTGGGYAVINNTVLKEGDTYQGFTIARIMADAVILNSDHGPHRLELPSLTAPPAPTNRPPAGAAPRPRLGRL